MTSELESPKHSIFVQRAAQLKVDTLLSRQAASGKPWNDQN